MLFLPTNNRQSVRQYQFQFVCVRALLATLFWLFSMKFIIRCSMCCVSTAAIRESNTLKVKKQASICLLLSFFLFATFLLALCKCVCVNGNQLALTTAFVLFQLVVLSNTCDYALYKHIHTYTYINTRRNTHTYTHIYHKHICSGIYRQLSLFH